MKNIKHKHGTPNAIIQTEEESILATIDRAIASSGNSQTIGRNGELPLISFLERHLPNTLSVKTGHFITPKGELSPQIDILVLDSRYPLLSENGDGSVLAMLHSVISCIEIKTNIKNQDIKKIWNNSKQTQSLASSVFNYPNGFGNLECVCFSYRANSRLDSLADKYFDTFTNDDGYTDLYLLRLPDKDQINTKQVGALLHLEPDFGNDGASEVVGFTPTLIPEYTPLSDFFYSLVQNSYYCLNSRDFSIGDIGEHFMDYMSWSTMSKN